MGKLEKAQIFIMKVGSDKVSLTADTDYDPIDVCFNPKEYSVEKGADWEQSKAFDEAPMPEFKAPKPMTMSVTLQFDTYEERVSVREKYVKRIERLVLMNKTAGKPDKKNNKPPVLMFVWGKFAFKGVAESVSQKYTMFLTDGTPVRAECALKIRNVSSSSIDSDDKGTDNRQKGLQKGAEKQYAVKDGDRLDLIAANELGDSSRWVEIAALNSIDDPTSIKAGQNLKIPG